MLLASLLLVTALLMRIPVAHADLTICSWTGPGRNPEAAGYKWLCDGEKTDETDTTATYICAFLYERRILVADYGVLAPRRLEFATACNGGGYMHNWLGECFVDYVSVCLGDRDPKTNEYMMCYSMSAWDDCEWPVDIDEKYKPEWVHIWYHHVQEAAEESTAGGDAEEGLKRGEGRSGAALGELGGRSGTRRLSG